MPTTGLSDTKRASFGSRVSQTLRRWHRVLLKFQPDTRPRLSQILGNQLCPPLDLRSLRYFLTYHERSYENLSFYEFFVAYWILWSKLSKEERRGSSPIVGRALRPDRLPSFPQLSVSYPSEPITLNDVLIGSERADYPSSLACDSDTCRITLPPCKASPVENIIIPDTEVAELRQVLLDFCGDLNLPSTHAHRLTLPAKPDTLHTRASQLTFDAMLRLNPKRASNVHGPVRTLAADSLPLADVVSAALNRFIVQGAVEELNLSQKVRRTLLDEAQKTTHPSIFEPVYNEVVQMLEHTVEGPFSAWTVKNISRAEAFRRSRTFIPLILITILMLTLMIYYGVSRWWRLFTLPLVLVITSYFITNTRGVCVLKYLSQTRDRRLIGPNRIFGWLAPKPLNPDADSIIDVRDELYYMPNYRIPSILSHFIVNFEGHPSSPSPKSMDTTSSLATRPEYSTFDVKSDNPGLHTKAEVSDSGIATVSVVPQSALEPRKSSQSAEWIEMNEPLVQRGQREVLIHAAALAVVITVLIECFFVALP
ncbi:hypothetical protein IWQ60_003490 [Tieghemiomyces parasiticus]|uniref:RGS domain-containing protein n=1 Tax=Tieghemiomyces parasiticus TaxID=78921 RepID=A0A9W8ACS4_9FUNG|nr:hypothetical protein IWQ60_003490 [Tieghemiomyces parasiticus]